MNSLDNLTEAKIDNDEVIVTWSDGFTSGFHFIWLRDNCLCDACGDPSIGRRKLRLTEIAQDVHPDSCRIEGNVVFVHWNDGHDSAFYENWLRAHAYDNRSRRARLHNYIPWDNEYRKNPVELDYGIVTSDSEMFYKVMSALLDYGLCFIKDAPLEEDTLESLATRIGPIQESNFGRIQDIVIDRDKRSIANSFEALKPHTDEPYRASPPGVLMFHCVETDIEGAGASVFLDGFEAAETLRTEDPDKFRCLCNNSQGFRRHFAGDVDLVASFPPISIDEFDNITGVRINDRVNAPLSIAADQVRTYYMAMKRLLELCEDEDRMISKVLRPGDIAVFDNHRILHGRTELTMNGRRRLRWAQVERGDLFSTLRIAAERQNRNQPQTPGRGAYG